MKLAIMQPYFFPYIGYFQLINAVDQFVVYDDIQYTKKGWINRNRILIQDRDDFFSKKDSDYLDICQRTISENYHKDFGKILNKIKESYKKAPFFNEVFPFIEDCFLIKERNLFLFIFYSINKLVKYFEIKTNLIVSSDLGIKGSGENRVISICKQLNASNYINAIGGQKLYHKETFEQQGINLQFINTTPITYAQFNTNFIPWLSIIDVMMFNPKDEIIKMLDLYTLV